MLKFYYYFINSLKISAIVISFVIILVANISGINAPEVNQHPTVSNNYQQSTMHQVVL